MRILSPLAGVWVSVLSAGCYTLRPAGTAAPTPGDRIGVEINDQGRVALGGALGSEIAQVEGRFIEGGNDDLLLAVRSVKFLRGGEQTWTGELVRIKAAHVATRYERRFSPTRSMALGVASVGGFAAFLVTRELLGGGQREREPGDPGPIPDQLRRP